MTIYEFTNIEFGGLRTVVDDNGDVWFASVDVCRVLGIIDNRVAVRRLKNNEKGVYIIPTLGGPQKLLVVNEPGLYRLIFTSRKPEAERFQYWVFHEVLPKLRMSDMYYPVIQVPEWMRKNYNRSRNMAEKLNELQQENNTLLQNNALLQNDNNNLHQGMNYLSNHLNESNNAHYQENMQWRDCVNQQSLQNSAVVNNLVQQIKEDKTDIIMLNDKINDVDFKLNSTEKNLNFLAGVVANNVL
jgi:prophage antirepressor-like protein